jgi:hypothetical protein
MILVVKLEVKGTLGRPGHRRKDNIKMYCKKIAYPGVEMINLA